MLPNKAGSFYQRTKNAVGPTEVDEINRQRAEKEALDRIANMALANKGPKGPVVYDNFGYVVAQVAEKIEESPSKTEKQDTKRERSPKRDRDRDRDRDR